MSQCTKSEVKSVLKHYFSLCLCMTSDTKAVQSSLCQCTKSDMKSVLQNNFLCQCTTGVTKFMLRKKYFPNDHVWQIKSVHALAQSSYVKVYSVTLQSPVQLICHQRKEMERFPDEILLNIFSFLPRRFLFGAVSVVCRRFHRLAYDYSSLRRSKSLIKEINLKTKSLSSVQRLLKIIRMVPSYVKYMTIQECDPTWQVFEVVATTCSELNILNVSYMKGYPKLGKEMNLFAFHHLLELNVSNTLIDDIFINRLSQSCKILYSLNISSCPNVTDLGLMTANFNLMLLNIAHCHFQFTTIVHILREFDVQVLCIQGIHTAVRERTRLASMYPSCIDIGIPCICGFSLPGYQDLPENLCFWCRNSNRCTFLDSRVDPDKLYEIQLPFTLYGVYIYTLSVADQGGGSRGIRIPYQT